MAQSFFKAIKYESILLLVTFLAALLTEGHLAAIVALAAHLPTSLLTILVLDNVSVDIDQETWFFVIAVGTILLHVLFITSICNYTNRNRG